MIKFNEKEGEQRPTGLTGVVISSAVCTHVAIKLILKLYRESVCSLLPKEIFLFVRLHPEKI